MSIAIELVESAIEMPGKFVEVAAQGPIEALLVLLGAVFVTVPSLVFGYLALGAGIDFLRADQTETRHP